MLEMVCLCLRGRVCGAVMSELAGPDWWSWNEPVAWVYGYYGIRLVMVLEAGECVLQTIIPYMYRF